MNWTKEQYLEYMERRRRASSGILRQELSHAVSKYRSEKTDVDGHVFDSVREASVYQGLKLAERSGVISGLELQPRFLLQEAFRDRKGKSWRAIYYVADFRYTDAKGHVVVVDVKSKITESNPVYRLKRKMLLFRYPDIDFREVY